MSYVINGIIALICFVLAHFFGLRIRHLIPKGKESGIGLACSLAILVIAMAIDFFYSSVIHTVTFIISIGLGIGLISGIKKQNSKE